MSERHLRKAQRPLSYALMLLAGFAVAAASAWSLAAREQAQASAPQR